MSQKEPLFEKIISSGMRTEGVKLILDDFFYDERVDFSWILTLIYGMSFAKKSLGSKFHKSMAILEKMADMEGAFLEIGNEDPALKGNIGNLEAFV